MGTGQNYKKEFWWEREWRHVGDFTLPENYIVLCPEHEIGALEQFTQSLPQPRRVRMIDPFCGLDQIIARLAGFDDEEVVRCERKFRANSILGSGS